MVVLLECSYSSIGTLEFVVNQNRAMFFVDAYIYICVLYMFCNYNYDVYYPRSL